MSHIPWTQGTHQLIMIRHGSKDSEPASCGPCFASSTMTLAVPDPDPDAEVLTLDQFSRLVASIYRGPLESPPWKSFLEELKFHLDASFTTLILRPAALERPSVMVTAGATETQGIDRYNSHFYEFDPFVNLPRDKVVLATEILGERNWLDSVIYREFLKPLDILHLLGLDLAPSQEGEDCRLRATRSHGQSPFGLREKALCQSILPHLKQSVMLCAHMDQLDIERRLLVGTVERMQVGTVTLDERGRLLSINREAQVILDVKDGIRISSGVLTADYAEENAKLQQLIAAALAGKLPERAAVVEAVSITRPSGNSKLSVLVRVIPASDWSGTWNRPQVAIFLRDPEHQSTQSVDVIRRLFELTHAEAMLAMLLANGLTLDEAAEQLNIRRNTARAHLRSIFSKMGVTRQTELVRLVLNSVVQLG